jgi:hypothetical protein
VLTYRATIPLSTRTLTHVADLVRARRRAIAKSLGSALTSRDATVEPSLSAAGSALNAAQGSAPRAPARGCRAGWSSQGRYSRCPRAS